MSGEALVRAEAAAHRVTLANTGQSFRCAANCSLLAGMELAVRQGIPAGCRNGGCGVCKVRVLDGRVERGKMSRSVIGEHEEAAGYALACKAYPRSDVWLDVVGKMARAFEARKAASFDFAFGATRGERDEEN